MKVTKLAHMNVLVKLLKVRTTKFMACEKFYDDFESNLYTYVRSMLSLAIDSNTN